MLTVRDHMTLTLAGARFKHAGAREAVLRDHLGMTSVRHAQVLSALLDRPDVEAAYPVLVRRLRRLREARRLRRSA